MHEVEYMRSTGLALGGHLDMAIVMMSFGVLNPDGHGVQMMSLST